MPGMKNPKYQLKSELALFYKIIHIFKIYNAIDYVHPVPN